MLTFLAELRCGFRRRGWQSHRWEHCMQTLWSFPCNSDVSSKQCPVDWPACLCNCLFSLRSGSHRLPAMCVAEPWDSLPWARTCRLALPCPAQQLCACMTALHCAQRSACTQAARPLPSVSDGPHRPVFSRRPPTAAGTEQATTAQLEHCARSKRRSTRNSSRRPPKCSWNFLFHEHWYQFGAVRSQVFWSTLESLQLLPVPPDSCGTWHAATIAEHSTRLHTLRLLNLEVLDGAWDTPLLHAVSSRLSYLAPLHLFHI